MAHRNSHTDHLHHLADLTPAPPQSLLNVRFHDLPPQTKEQNRLLESANIKWIGTVPEGAVVMKRISDHRLLLTPRLGIAL